MRRRSVVFVGTALVIVSTLSSLVYFFWYVPHVYGRRFVAVSFAPQFYTGPGTPHLHLNYQGAALDVMLISIELNITNSYFQPVYINYDGFDVVWLVYNRTVSDPADVVSNRHSLVWGAYDYLGHTSIPDPARGVYDFSEDGFEFYAANRELSNFQIDIPTGNLIHSSLFMPPGSVPGSWSGQYWFNTTSLVPPGTYFMYCLIYGIPCNPQNVTITSIDLL